LDMGRLVNYIGGRLTDRLPNHFCLCASHKT
jgi:hypothetical protein